MMTTVTVGNPYAIHYSDAIMSTMASHIICVSIVCRTVCSGVDQRNHQNSASLAFVSGIHPWPVDFHHNSCKTNSNECVSLRRWSKINISQQINGDFHERINDCKEAFVQAFSFEFLRVFIDRSSTSHSPISPSEGEPVNNKETNELPTSRPLSNIVCLIVAIGISATQYNIKLVWWLVMAWYLFGANASAFIVMT